MPVYTNIIEITRKLISSRDFYFKINALVLLEVKMEVCLPLNTVLLDIISPYIFIIAVEILLIKITQSKNIKGVKIGKKECRAQTFADDTTIFIEREENSLRACIKYIEDFKSISGLAANLDKTNVIPYGKLFNPGCKICPD